MLLKLARQPPSPAQVVPLTATSREGRWPPWRCLPPAPRS